MVVLSFLVGGLSLLRPPLPVVSFLLPPAVSVVLSPGCRVGVVGSRSFPAVSLVRSFVAALPAGCLVCSGAGGVVDLAARSAALSAWLGCLSFPAAWGRWGRSAGPRRSGVLVAAGLSCLCVFLSSPSAPSPGSAACVRLALAAGVPVFVFGPGGFVGGFSQLSLF